MGVFTGEGHPPGFHGSRCNMGYGKWDLNQKDAYQVAVAIFHAAHLALTDENECDGPFEMAYEAEGLGGWDDILVLRLTDGELHSTHYQVKEQHSDFEYTKGEEALAKYFRDAFNLLGLATPYGHITNIHPSRREFALCFPDLSVGLRRKGHQTVLKITSLNKLADTCRGPGDPHLEIAHTRGATLGSSDEREWLSFVESATGGLVEATTVLRQFCAQPIGTLIQVQNNTRSVLAPIWKSPDEVLASIERMVRRTNPSSRLRSRDVSSFIGAAERITQSLKVVLCKQPEGYFFRRGTDAAEVVRSIWQSANASHLCINFPCQQFPVEESRIRTAVLRLAVHTSGVTVVNSSRWFTAAWEGLGAAVGDGGEPAYSGESFFRERSVTAVPADPRGAKGAIDTSSSLHEAMDQWVWTAVDLKIREILNRDAHDSIRDRLIQGWSGISGPIKTNWPRALRTLLKASCESKAVSAELRAGPRMISLIAQTLVVALAIHSLGYSTVGDADNGLLGKIGDSPVTGLALEKLSSSPSQSGGVDLWERAKDVLTGAGILVLGTRTSAADLENVTNASLLSSAIGPPSINNLAAPVVLVSFDLLFQQGLKASEAQLRSHLEQRMNATTIAVSESFKIALKEIAEGEDADEQPF